jgi:hypothetical protein
MGVADCPGNRVIPGSSRRRDLVAAASPQQVFEIQFSLRAGIAAVCKRRLSAASVMVGRVTPVRAGFAIADRRAEDCPPYLLSSANLAVGIRIV